MRVYEFGEWFSDITVFVSRTFLHSRAHFARNVFCYVLVNVYFVYYCINIIALISLM